MVRRSSRRPYDGVEQGLEEFPRQATARLAIGRCGKALIHQIGHGGAGDIAVQHLREKGMDGVDRIENAFAINDLKIAANRLDDRSGQGRADIRLESANHL